MQRYSVSQFDGSSFVVIDQVEQREICVCSNYDEYTDAENRAQAIATLLNENVINLVHP
jgi:hypothetical protein